ncbi:hypothetical protein ACH492_33055 [Streptomyces sp. NPDC019443]|uniref:hypothetical protein n=1 Tax=Streptomyces sp. NPDC019443 TaxID=3365061 RepID=UPI0037BD7A4A
MTTQGTDLVPARAHTRRRGPRRGLGADLARGLVCRRPGQRTRLIFRMLVHHGAKYEKKCFREKDFARLLDAVHQQLGGNMVLLSDN